jgi:hypothetical protein
VPSRFFKGQALVLTGLLLGMPSELSARPHGPAGYAYPRAYGGRYAGGYGGRYAYGYPAYYGRAYAAYPRYYGYAGYPRYYGYHNHYNNGAWIAVGAGLLGVMLGAALARPRVYAYPYQPYVQQPVYPNQAPPAQAPATQQCPDGSTVYAGNYCPEMRVPRG